MYGKSVPYLVIYSTIWCCSYCKPKIYCFLIVIFFICHRLKYPKIVWLKYGFIQIKNFKYVFNCFLSYNYIFLAILFRFNQNMFESDILNIRKVRFRSNMQCFESFGQPTQTQNDQNSKWKLVKIRWNPKFGLSNFENDLLTSTTSEWAQRIFPKITFLKSGNQAEKNEQ